MASNLRRVLKNIKIFNVGSILDLSAVLASCRDLPSIESFVVVPSHYEARVKLPISLENLPPKLHTLTLDLAGAFEAAYHNIAPSLLHLSLTDSFTSNPSFKQLSLPPSLQSLVLQGLRSVPMDKFDVKALPRTLTELDIDAVWNFVPSSYEWPLSLTSACFRGSQNWHTLEHLPRTVTSLRFGEKLRLKTTFRGDSAQRVFPWRVFFPRLSYLHLPSTLPDFEPSLLLRSIVDPDALESGKVATFMASGFGTLESLSDATRGPFPLFTGIQLPFVVWSQEPSLLITQFQLVAPYIRTVDLIGFQGCSTLLVHAGITSRATVTARSNYEKTAPLQFPTTLKTLTILEGITLADIPRSLTGLTCKYIYARSDAGRDHDFADVQLPDSLTYLKLTLTPFLGLVNILPLSLTELHIIVRSPEPWNSVASRLVSLRKLYVAMGAYWSCYAPLVPLKATQLDTFELSSPWPRALDASQPRLCYFFSPHYCAGQALLPSSITRLSIDYPLAHASLIAALPQGLQFLTFRLSLVWTDLADSLPIPEGAGLSPEQLFKLLPRGLRTLDLGTGPGSALDVQLLRFLPPRLVKFRACGSFNLSDDDKEKMNDILPITVNYAEFERGWFLRRPNIQ